MCRTIIILSAIFTTGCVNENWSGCFPPTITVTLEAVEGHDRIDPADVDHIWLHIFEAEEGKLLDRILLPADQIGVPQVVDYPGAGPLKAVAVVNCMESTVLSDFSAQNHISAGTIGLKPVSPDYQGKPQYEICDDLMWGETTVMNNARGASENAILPVKRIVAGVYIRISGLDNIPGLDLNQIIVALGAQYNTFSFAGTPSYNATRSAASNIYYVPSIGCHPQNTNVIEAPAYTGSGEEDQFFRILSTDEGGEIGISIFNGGEHFGTITHDKNSNPLTAKNGKLNVFEIDFDDSGEVKVTVSQAQWGETPEVEIDF